MAWNSHQTPPLYRFDEEADSRRILYPGILSTAGGILAIFHVVHLVADFVEGMGILALLTGAAFPLLLSVGIVSIGYGLWRSELPTTQLRRIVIWFVLGIGGIALLGGASAVYEVLEGARLTHIRFFMLNFVTGGGIVGLLVGWYDVQNQLHAEQLRVFKKAVEHSGHSICLTAPDGTIEYVNPQFETQTGYDRKEAIGQTPAILKSGEHDERFYEDLWNTILDGEVWTGEVVNQRRSGEQYTVTQTIAPVTDDSGEIERFAAINADITDQKRRQRELKRQQDELSQLHRLMATMWEVTQALVSASTRSELETGVCEALTSTEFCDAAWFATYDRRTDTLVPSAGDGIDIGDIETISLSDGVSPVSGTPLRNAVDSHEVVVERSDAKQVTDSLLSNGQGEEYDACTSIPILQDRFLLGTLNLYANRRRAFNEDERPQLEELGDVVAHGLHTIKTRKLLHADHVLELELRTQDDRDLLVDVSAQVDCSLSLEGMVPLSDERALLYVELESSLVNDALDAVESLPDIEETNVVTEGESRARLAFEVRSAGSMTKRLMDVGAEVVDASASDGEVTIVSHVSPDEDVRSLVQAVRQDFSPVELVAKRETERQQELDHSTVAELSERQRAALHAAYHAGYFESPRESTAEEIASSMGISGPTFHKHLRRAQNRIFDSLLDATQSRQQERA